MKMTMEMICLDGYNYNIDIFEMLAMVMKLMTRGMRRTRMMVMTIKMIVITMTIVMTTIMMMLWVLGMGYIGLREADHDVAAARSWLHNKCFGPMS